MPTRQLRIWPAWSARRCKVTLQVEAEVPGGVLDHVVRTVTENARTLKFTAQGGEEE